MSEEASDPTASAFASQHTHFIWGRPSHGREVTAALSGLSYPRNRADLLQQAELVKVLPFFGDLVANHTANDEPREGHLLAGRGDAKQVPLVGAPHGPAGCDLVPFTHLVLKRHLQVRESCEKHRDELFDALGTTHFLARSVPNIVRGDELVYDG